MATVVGESATGGVGQQSPYDDRARYQQRGRPISRVYVEGRRPRPEAGPGGPGVLPSRITP
ncbi:hypothetical protein ACFQ8O_37055 [Streptomyces coelicoflavus]|uniref:hypothetical protein n=1 Tax=Streptomyces coelicoflavus TaxID=285562 RepID=UPI0036AF681A